MQAQTLNAALSAAEPSSKLLVSYRTALWLALLTYPLVPNLLFHAAGLEGSIAAVTGFLLVYAWAVSGPVMAWLALCEADRVRMNRAEHPQLVKEAILAAIGAPFFVWSGVALNWIHLGGHQAALWYLLLAAVAASRLLPTPQARLTRGDSLQRVHRISAILLLLFGVAHVANHLAAVDSLQAHVTVQNWMRTVYRQPVIEALIVAAALSQVVTGWLVVSRVRLQRSTRLRNLQVLAGSFLGMFFISHLTGVFSGRFVQHVDTTFSWATGGPHGLLTNPRSPSMVPYYSLAVLAFSIHAATAGRWTLAPLMGQPAALKLCYAGIALGAVLTLALLLPMAGIHLG
ncbi:MAG TPA: hypothetical protein VJ732_17150 [Bryobacteraceae bacterium]|nr:hypothetical protein [Bryobacteraceae bacterium]